MTTVNLKDDSLKLMDHVISFYEKGGSDSWTMCAIARDKDGNAVGWFVENAQCFCTIGAFIKGSSLLWPSGSSNPETLSEHASRISERCFSAISTTVMDRVGYWNDHAKFSDIMQTLKTVRKKMELNLV